MIVTWTKNNVKYKEKQRQQNHIAFMNPAHCHIGDSRQIKTFFLSAVLLI